MHRLSRCAVAFRKDCDKLAGDYDLDASKFINKLAVIANGFGFIVSIVSILFRVFDPDNCDVSMYRMLRMTFCRSAYDFMRFNLA